MVPLAHAGDGGGSIRIPASMCGLFGLKPTRGRVSLGPDSGEAWGGLVVRHVITRSVRDSAAVLDVLAGAMPGDPYSAAPPVRPFLEEVGAEAGRLRIGVRTAAPGGLADVAPDCVDAVDDAVAALESLGHDVEPAAVDADRRPRRTRGVHRHPGDVGRARRRSPRRTDRSGGRPGRRGEPHLVALHRRPHDQRGGLRRSPRNRSSVVAPDGALVGTRRRRLRPAPDPHDGRTAPLLGELDSDARDPSPAMGRMVPFGIFTAPFNITGQPAMSVPTWLAGNLPIGVQLVAATGREDRLLRVAAQLERVRPWEGRMPGIFANG